MKNLDYAVPLTHRTGTYATSALASRKLRHGRIEVSGTKKKREKRVMQKL